MNTMQKTNPTLFQLLIYALPALPLAALTLPLYIIVPTFYSETLGLPLVAVGTALLAVRIFDAVNDPIIGWLADKWRPSFGRRRTVMGLSLPVAALSGFMLFAPPADATSWYLFIWACLLTVGFTGVSLPYSAWGAEMSGDYAVRAKVTGIRETFTLVGTLIAIALPFALGMDDANSWHGLAILGLFVAAGLVSLGAISILALPEPKEYSTENLSLTDGLKAMAGNSAFIRLIIAFFVNGLANGIPATLFLYFVSSVIGDEDLRGPLLFLYFLCGIAGVPLALWAARRTSKHRAWCFAMLLACLIFAGAPLLGEGDVTGFAVLCVITGLCLGFDIVLPAAIQADVIDADTAKSGEQRSGTYFAAWSLSTKMSLALGVGIAFPMLAALGFNPAPGAANTPQSLFALAIVYAWVPVALKIIAIGLMWNFPLGEAEQANLRQQIEAKA
jgi:glycoside/pentoside/hexuronide:cation symporter, GPH family